MKPPHVVEVPTYRGGTEVHVRPSFAITFEAELAREFVARWGLVAAEPDGEDSAGRQKQKLPTPESIIERATTLAQRLGEELERRGWIIDLPCPKEPEPRT